MCNLGNGAFLGGSSSGPLTPEVRSRTPQDGKLPFLSLFTHQHVFLSKDPPAILTLVHIYI